MQPFPPNRASLSSTGISNANRTYVIGLPNPLGYSGHQSLPKAYAFFLLSNQNLFAFYCLKKT